MKKKVIFMVINMNIGGTEKALLNMINMMPSEKFEITILMLEQFGGFLYSIPKHVKVRYLDGYQEIKAILNSPPRKVALNYLKKGKLIAALRVFYCNLVRKISGDPSIFFKVALRNYPILETQYDIAVAYAGPMDFISFFVINRIKAKRKIQWIHFDITKVGFYPKFANEYYPNFDRIYVVSNEGREKLVLLLPKLETKTKTFNNILSSELVVKMSREENGFEDNFDGYRILTVGRLSKEKGQDLTIRVLAKLKALGFNVRWYCIGEGNARREYEQLIEEFQLENDYILLGSSSNPYPFMAQCDLYVQPSRHEGYCITLTEAKCFSKPIISTNFTGAKEQITNNKTGLIINFDEEEMLNALIKLLTNQNLRIEIMENLMKEIKTKKEKQENISSNLMRVFL